MFLLFNLFHCPISEWTCPECLDFVEDSAEVIETADTVESIIALLGGDDFCLGFPSSEMIAACQRDVEAFMPVALPVVADFMRDNGLPNEICASQFGLVC